MSREKTLVKNTAIISIGKICTSAITFLLLPLYTGILSTKEYGIVDLLNTLLSLLVPLITLQLEKAVFRELIDNRDNEANKKKIITTAIIATLLQCLIFLALYFIFSIFHKNDYAVFLEINIIAFIFLSLFQQIARGIDKISTYAISNFISAASVIIFNIVFLVFLKLGVYGMLLGTFIGYIIATLYLLLSLHIRNYIDKKALSKNTLIGFLKYSIPLVPNSLAWWIFSASDKVIVSSILGIDQNGILAASLKFSTIITTVYGIFDIGWIESITANIDDMDIEKYFNKVFNSILALFFAVGLIMISFMPIIFPIMINNNYSSGYNLIPITIISAMFNVMQGMVAVIYAAKKNTKTLSNTSVIAAIINIITHIALIHFIGLYAAVVSTLVSLVTMSVHRIINVRKKYLKVSLNCNNLIITPIFFIIITILFYINNPYLNVISMVTSIFYVYFANKQHIGIIKQVILRKVGKIHG